jgi:hypothetical protein
MLRPEKSAGRDRCASRSPAFHQGAFVSSPARAATPSPNRRAEGRRPYTSRGLARQKLALAHQAPSWGSVSHSVEALCDEVRPCAHNQRAFVIVSGAASIHPIRSTGIRPDVRPAPSPSPRVVWYPTGDHRSPTPFRRKDVRGIRDPRRPLPTSGRNCGPRTPYSSFACGMIAAQALLLSALGEHETVSAACANHSWHEGEVEPLRRPVLVGVSVGMTWRSEDGGTDPLPLISVPVSCCPRLVPVEIEVVAEVPGRRSRRHRSAAIRVADESGVRPSLPALGCTWLTFHIPGRARGRSRPDPRAKSEARGSNACQWGRRGISGRSSKPGLVR